MKKLGHYFSQIFALLFRILPWSANIFFAKALRFLWLDVLQIRKKVILENLDIAFPEMPKSEKLQIARLSVESMTRSFFDIMRIPSLQLLDVNSKHEWIEQNVVFHGAEKIQKYDHGLLFLSLHLGSGDLSAAIVSSKVRKLALITKRFKNSFLDQFWFSLRGQALTQFIDPHDPHNAFSLLKALKEKKGVCFVMDQFMGKPYGVESLFFGRKTGTAYGLAAFALKTRHPVIPLYTRWDPEGKLHIYFDEPIDFSGLITEDKEATISNVVNRLNLELERIVRQYPGHWMWVHRRWKTFE